MLAGNKRPLHTIIPAFMSQGDVRIAFGIMGGWNQAQAHAQFVSHIVDYKQNIQLAMETARFTKGTFGGCDVELENRIPGNVRAELEAKGHILQDAQRIFQSLRRRTSRHAGFRRQSKLWRVRSAKRWRRNSGVAVLTESAVLNDFAALFWQCSARHARLLKLFQPGTFSAVVYIRHSTRFPLLRPSHIDVAPTVSTH